MNTSTHSRHVAALTAGLATAVSLCACCGCASQPSFPAPIEIRAKTNETVFAFDTDGDQQPDFWQYQRPAGRKYALAYATDKSARPGPRIDLDAINPAECPHFVIVLDGVPFELVDQLYREGHFRFFHPPAKVVCCFPSMTDLALNELFHTGRCLAYQALYFDRQANRLTDGTAVYLSARNSAWLAQMDYRCSFWWDAQAYLNPQALFNHEINGTIRTFRSIEDGESYAYTVGTAGLGTRGGRAAILRYLRTIDRLCEQIVFERRGRVKLTLTADHGHNLVENRRISFRKVLQAGGYRQAKSLRKPRDVVPIAYGLVTYAAFYTNDPAGVAACLVQHEDVEFACYPADDAVIVCDQTGHARITKGETGFVYDSREGDPLKLNPIIEQLRRDGKVSADGEIDDEALFSATVDHYYPDPLARIWAAFHELVENPPDVIVNLRDGACYGSRFFRAMIGKVASTHGSLNRANSTTFVLTMLGELPAALRSRDVTPALQALRSEPPRLTNNGVLRGTVGVTRAYADRLTGVRWGHQLDALRAGILTPTTQKQIGEPIPVVVVLQNQGSSRAADTSAWLAPTVRLDIWRNDWHKAVFLPIRDYSSSLAIALEKGEEFYYAADLTRVVDLDVPGEYIVTGGYDSVVSKSDRCWKGGVVRSALSPPIRLVGVESRATAATKPKPPPADRKIRESAWGEPVRGLRCKISIRAGSYSVGEPIAATITIENLGTPDPDGRAQLFPHLDLWVRRAGWQKYVMIRLQIQNRLTIEKGKTFTHSLDLSETVDLTVGGAYAVSGGHSNHIVTDIGDWTGTVRSPFQNGISIVDQ